MMQLWKYINQYIAYIEESVLICALIICMFSLFLNIILRSIFNFILAFPPELSRYLMIYIIYIGMSLAYKKESQLKLDILMVIFPKIKNYISITGDLISLIAAITIIYCGFKYTIDLYLTNEISSVMGLPLYILYGIAPVTAVMMSLRLIFIIIDKINCSEG